MGQLKDLKLVRILRKNISKFKNAGSLEEKVDLMYKLTALSVASSIKDEDLRSTQITFIQATLKSKGAKNEPDETK